MYEEAEETSSSFSNTNRDGDGPTAGEDELLDVKTAADDPSPSPDIIAGSLLQEEAKRTARMFVMQKFRNVMQKQQDGDDKDNNAGKAATETKSQAQQEKLL